MYPSFVVDEEYAIGDEMDVHKVFVIWIHPLFLESLRLILQNTAVQWVGSSSCYEAELPEVLRLKPDTILMEEENECRPIHLLDLMETWSGNFRVFKFSLADNDLRIYHKETKTVLQADDLLNLLLKAE